MKTDLGRSLSCVAKSVAFAFCAIVLAGCQTDSPSAASASNSWLLSNVTVVDTRTGNLSRNMAVLIEGDRIAQVAPVASFAQNGVRRVDGQGAYVVPGFNDMHTHPLNHGDAADSFALMLASGVTGFRQMAGSPELLAARRAGTLMPPNSPELLIMPGAILTQANALTPPAAIAEIQRQHEQGADFIKVVTEPPPAFFAALAEATRLNMPVAGHLPDGVDARRASEAGMRAIEHLGPQDTLLISCSTDEAAIRRAVAARPPGRPPVNLDAHDPEVLARIVANPIVAMSGAGFGQIRHVIDTYSPERCRSLADVFIAHHTWQTPTLMRLRAMQFGDDATLRNDPNLRFINPAERQMWNRIADSVPQHISAADRQTLADLMELQLRVVKEFDDAGVPMLAGSDTGGQWLVPGYALHQEFDLLARAHLSPLRVLQMTTLNAAQFLGREADMGTIEPGREANIVLLDGNPIEAVANLHRVGAVIRGGRYYSRSELDAMREAIAQQFVAH